MDARVSRSYPFHSDAFFGGRVPPAQRRAERRALKALLIRPDDRLLDDAGLDRAGAAVLLRDSGWLSRAMRGVGARVRRRNGPADRFGCR